jgi:hypothetical protein
MARNAETFTLLTMLQLKQVEKEGKKSPGSREPKTGRKGGGGGMSKP